MQLCSKDELWEAAKEEEMKIPWKEVHEGRPVPEDQYQERFWRRRLDGIGLDTVNRELLAIEFKRTQDTRSNYVEKATAVAQAQYSSLLERTEQMRALKIIEQLVDAEDWRGVTAKEFESTAMAAAVRISWPKCTLFIYSSLSRAFQNLRNFSEALKYL